MYLQSNELLNEIQIIINQISEATNGVVVFEEYIALPYYGNIILRFDLRKEDYTLEDLDAYEVVMYEIVKDRFLIDFMGSVYKKVGLQPQELQRILPLCYEKYKDELITKSTYTNKMQEDVNALLEICGLPFDKKVWEVQLEEEINLLLLEDAFKDLGEYSKDYVVIHVYGVIQLECEGLIKATMYAKRNHISLVRALLEV